MSGLDPDGFNTKKLALLACAEAAAEEHLAEQCETIKHEPQLAAAEFVATLKRRAADRSRRDRRMAALALVGLAHLSCIVRSEGTRHQAK